MATIVEVARLAGVSTSTVSHVINGTRPVAESTRQRVLGAIESTNYRQDAVARAMRRSQTDTIGLVVTEVGEPAYAEMIHGVEHAANEAGLTLLLASSREQAELEERAVRSLIERRVDGLIIARCTGSRPLSTVLDGYTSPVVLLDRLYDDVDFDQVGADNRESMARLLSRLRQRGHRRVVLIAGSLEVPTLKERHHGFVEAMGSDYDPSLVITGAEMSGLRSALVDCLGQGGVSCVVSASTPLAAMALRTMREMGLHCPDDIAFATMDGFSHSDLFEPTITSVRQPAFDMGHTAVELVLNRRRDPEARPRVVRLRQWLELGSSTEGTAPHKQH